jgi:hypothetical protein
MNRMQLSICAVLLSYSALGLAVNTCLAQLMATHAWRCEAIVPGLVARCVKSPLAPLLQSSPSSILLGLHICKSCHVSSGI